MAQSHPFGELFEEALYIILCLIMYEWAKGCICVSRWKGVKQSELQIEMVHSKVKFKGIFSDEFLIHDENDFKCVSTS